MPSQRQPIPTDWTSYERGGRTSSDASLGSHNRIHFDDEAQSHQPRQSADNGHLAATGASGQDLRRRRSSVNMAINSLRQAGGVNSLDNFARSWQRAAGFVQITPVRHSFRYADDQEDEHTYSRGDVTGTSAEGRGLLRAQLEDSRRVSDDALAEEDESAAGDLARTGTIGSVGSATPRQDMGEQNPLLRERASRLREDPSIFSIEPSLASPFGGSYGTTYSSLTSRVNEPSMRHAGRLFREQQIRGTSHPDKEREPLLVKQVQEDDGKVVNVIVGQSTLPQTIFNSVNVLVGVGLLALPLAMRYSGWVPGLVFFFLSAICTSYTAKLLAKCLDVDSSLITFADLAYVSFGPSARVATSILFSVELLGTCVALLVLFADSLNVLIPGYGLTEWKVVCGIILIPLSFAPLRLLSFTSVLGVLSCFGIVLAVFVDGMLKPHAPGSLREPMTTYIWPENWMTLPISFGLLMSPWGGHSVFPNIYRDMRHPYKYRKGIDITYIFTYLLDTFMAVTGLLMFGDGILDEVTKNVVITKGYPQWISFFIVVCVAIIPITKVPLNARPIVSTLELFLGLDSRTMSQAGQSSTGLSGLTRGILKVTVRILSVIVFVILAILVPDFDRIMSLLGAVACFTICLILPCGFHLKLFGHEMSAWHRTLDWTLIAVSSILALVSTAFNFVPKEKLGMA